MKETAKEKVIFFLLVLFFYYLDLFFFKDEINLAKITRDKHSFDIKKKKRLAIMNLFILYIKIMKNKIKISFNLLKEMKFWIINVTKIYLQLEK